MFFQGYERADGSVGIRNKVLIIAVDECCEGIARNIAGNHEQVVVLTNWYTCMLGGNEETYHQLIAVGQHPNVGAVLVLAMGCGSIAAPYLAALISAVGKPVDHLTCYREKGTRNTIAVGKTKLNQLLEQAGTARRVPCHISRITAGVKCGGSDTSSGLSSNPAVGLALDKLVDLGGTCIGGELFELQGCEKILRSRSVSPAVADKIDRMIVNERKRWGVNGVELETMSVGNCVGGISTIEEKSLGAMLKTGTRPIQDILKIDKDGIEKPSQPGFYLSDATMLCGGSGINFAALGAHMILWTTGGAGFDNPLVPVIRVSGNKEFLNDDMDIDATGIMDGTASMESVAQQIVEKVVDVASGTPTAVEGLGWSTLTLVQKDQRVEKLLCLN